MSPSGKGISDAVRDIAPEWFDAQTTQKAAAAASLKPWEASCLRVGGNWTRCRSGGRRRGANGGWVRNYYCKGVPEDAVQLTVRCNEQESKIVYFTIRANGKTIDGGVTDVASAFLSGAKNKARVGGTVVSEKETSVSSKTGFRRMSPEELQRIATEVDFDGFADMFEVRE